MDNFKNAMQSLTSIKKIDDYGMFRMTYFGDYGFNDFLKVGVKKDEDIGAFAIKHLLTGIPINFNFSGDNVTDISGSGCTVFTARNAKDEILLCRNYDFMYAPYSPSLQLITRPDNGYASVSTVNLLFMGYHERHLPRGLNLGSFATLSAPFAPMDGMNEKGVAAAILMVPESKLPFDESKITLNTTTALRLVLDKAANTAEAMELLSQYNIYFSQNLFCQYFIADKNGQSAIVNFIDGKMKITTPNKPYQIATNFAASDFPTVNACAGYCERYDIVLPMLENNGGILSEKQAVDLLAQVAVIDNSDTGNGKTHLQWSVVYNLSTLDGIIFANRKKNDLINFGLTL